MTHGLVRKKVEVVNYPEALADVAERERISINSETRSAQPLTAAIRLWLLGYFRRTSGRARSTPYQRADTKFLDRGVS